MSVVGVVQKIEQGDKTDTLTIRTSTRVWDPEQKKAVFRGLFIKCRVWAKFQREQVAQLQQDDPVMVGLSDISVSAWVKQDGTAEPSLSAQITELSMERRDQGGGNYGGQRAPAAASAPSGASFPDDVPF